MSSEHDESGELMDEGLAKSDAEKSDSPSPKKSGGVAKPRRRGRRGKKRKQRKESGDSHYSEEQEGSRAYESEPWDSEEEKASESSNYSGQMLRPNAPHAPKNSTQFIIDDHNECRLYMSFETPNPYLTPAAENNGDIIMEPIGEDAAYVDIDYQYESPQDFDNTAYYDREFELSYKSNRFEELLRLPRERLVSGLRQLEQRLKELSDDLVKENPSPILEKLQHDLLELQEKHCELQETNSRLTALVAQKEDGRTDENQCREKQDERTIKNDLSAEIEEFPIINNENLSSEMNVEKEKKLSNDVSIETDIELREELPSGDLVEKSYSSFSDPICDKQLRLEVEIDRKQSIKGDLSNISDNVESAVIGYMIPDKQSSDPMEVVLREKGKDCLEGQLSKVDISEQTDCDSSKRIVLGE